MVMPRNSPTGQALPHLRVIATMTAGSYLEIAERVQSAKGPPMKRIERTLHNLLQDESGQDLIEYAMAAGLVGAGAVVALRGTSSDIGSAFSNAANSIASRF